MPLITEDIKKKLEHQQYGLVGDHSACKICHWTKKSLLDEGTCYKETFYGVKAHSCCQMTPSLICCNSCIFCWRNLIPGTTSKEFGLKPDEPEEIIQGCIEQQRILLSGFGGNKKTNKEKLKEAFNPKYWAISLAGEPTFYPKLSELISQLKKDNCCTFLVTNGQLPNVLEKIELPTQLYLSLDAPTEKLYKEIDKSLNKDSWQRLNKTLELFPSLSTRKVIRLTLIKNLNMNHIEEYAKLIKKANPDFIECKGYMFVGSSRSRLKKENMPYHEEIVEFSKKLAELTGIKLVDEKKESRVALLSNLPKNKRKLKF